MAFTTKSLITRVLLIVLASVPIALAQTTMFAQPIETNESFIKVVSAIDRDDLVSLRTELDAGFDPNTSIDGFGPLLHRAAQAGSIQAVIALVDAGADIDQRDPASGYTPIMVAASYGHKAIVSYLDGSGADLSTVGAAGETLAYLQELGGIAEQAPASPQESTEPSKEDIKRLTDLLFQASEVGDAYLVKGLINSGADVGATDENGWTPLMYASLSAYDPDLYIPVARQLLSADANQINQTDQNGFNALMISIISKADTAYIGWLAKQEHLDFSTITTNGEQAHDLAYRVWGSEADEVLRRMPPQNMDYMFEDISKKIVGLGLDGSGMSRAEWEGTQRFLREVGLYDGVIDGIAGRQTKRAIIAFLDEMINDIDNRLVAICDRIRIRVPTIIERLYQEYPITTMGDHKSIRRGSGRLTTLDYSNNLDFEFSGTEYYLRWAKLENGRNYASYRDKKNAIWCNLYPPKYDSWNVRSIRNADWHFSYGLWYFCKEDPRKSTSQAILSSYADEEQRSIFRIDRCEKAYYGIPTSARSSDEVESLIKWENISEDKQ